MSKLVVAEKPSVAQSLARVIGATKRQDGYLEGPCRSSGPASRADRSGAETGYVVSWCVGHLVELSAPERYDERFAKFSDKAQSGEFASFSTSLFTGAAECFFEIAGNAFG